MKEVCRAIITNVESKVLLGKRARGVGADLYALIGGKPDANESISDAVIREVKEEIGLDFNPTLYLEVLDSISVPGETWKVTYFTGVADGTLQLKDDEISEAIYVSEDELEGLSIAFDHRNILKNYFRNIA